MKALLLESYGRLVYRDVPDPTVGPSDVLIRVKVCGICGSDVHGMDGSTGRRKPPLIMGHEAAGVVESAGSAVTRWRQGDRVTFDSTIYSLDDWYTLNGRYNLSDDRQVIGVSPGDYCRHGAFAELIAVPEHVLHRIPDTVSFREAALVEPVAVAMHAARQAQPSLSDLCVVVGAGAIGLLVVKLLKLSGVAAIVAIDIDGRNRERAALHGADLVLSPDDPSIDAKIREFGNGRGADCCFEAVGIDETVNLALRLLRKGGICVLVGNLRRSVELPLQSVVTRELTLRGSCGICGEYPLVLSLIERKRLAVDDLVAHVAPLAEGADWFSRLARGEASGKVLLEP